MYFKPATIAYVTFLLSVNAQPFDLYTRDAEPKANVKNFFKDIGQDFKAYGEGFASNFGRRDLEGLIARDPKFHFKDIVKDVAQGLGTFDGAAIKSFVSRDIDGGLQTREAGFNWKNALHNAEQIGGTLAGDAAKMIKFVPRDPAADVDVDFNGIYVRSPKKPSDVLKGVDVDVADILGQARKQRHHAEAEPKRSFSRRKSASRSKSGSKSSTGTTGSLFRELAPDLIHAVPDLFQTVPDLIDSFKGGQPPQQAGQQQGQQQPGAPADQQAGQAQRRWALADPEAEADAKFDEFLELYVRDAEAEPGDRSVDARALDAFP